MPVWKVENRATGEIVYAYTADAPVEWPGMEFTTHNHIAEKAPPDVPNKIITKREFIKRFTVDEYATIKAAAQQNVMLDYYWQQFMLAEEINLGDPDTIAGVTILEQVGLIAQGRAVEILQ